MQEIAKWIVRYLRLAVGALGISKGVNSVIFYTLYSRSEVHWCGNFFVGSVASMELGLLSLVFTIDVLTCHPYKKGEVILWAVPLMGLVLTLAFFGIFVFVVGFGWLVISRQRTWLGWLEQPRSAL